MADNIKQENKEGWKYGDGKWYIQPSVGAFAGDFSDVPVWQGVLHTVVVFLCILDLLAFRHFLNKRGDEFDFDTIRPSHFTVWIKDLNKDFDCTELVEFMGKNGRGGERVAEVYSVNMPYDIGTYIATCRSAAKFREKQLFAQEYRNATGKEPSKYRCCCCCPRASPEFIEASLVALEKKLEAQQISFHEGIKSLQIGQAFVTFKRQTDARAVAMNWKRSGLSTFFHWLCQSCFSRPLHFRNSYFYAKLAPEPSDIVWENLNVSWVFRLYRRVITWTVMVLVCAGSFFLCLFIKSVQKSWMDDQAQTSGLEYYRFKLFGFLLSIAIVFINQALGVLARLLTEQEKHQTWTHFYLSVAYKLCIFQLINSTVLLIVINAISLSGWERTLTWWTPNGLVNDVLNLMYVECTVGPLTSIFSPKHIIKLLRRRRLERQDKSGCITVTQSEANEYLVVRIYENVPVDMAQWYANIIRLLFLTFVFAPIVPLASIFGLLALGVNYWTNKVLLLRRHSRPRLLGMELSDYIFAWLPVVILAYAASNFVVGLYGGREQTIAPACALAVSAVFCLVPSTLCLARKPIEDNGELRERVLPSYYDDYEQNAVYFLEDYARANPVTAQQGWAAWLRLVQRHMDAETLQNWTRKSHVPEQVAGASHIDRLYEYAVRTSAISPVDRPRKGQRFSNAYWK